MPDTADYGLPETEAFQPMLHARSGTISVEEYLNTSYSPDREYRDGYVLERNLGDNCVPRSWGCSKGFNTRAQTNFLTPPVSSQISNNTPLVRPPLVYASGRIPKPKLRLCFCALTSSNSFAGSCAKTASLPSGVFIHAGL